jgi:ABC-type dipeptide/oligopeptide/nickel transport system permease subunit
MATTSSSFQQAAWRRLRRNKGAMFGLVVIVLSVLVAVFAYFIAPDSSPYANRIILEIGGEKPGYRQTFLKVRNTRARINTSFFQRLMSGTVDQYNYLPVTTYEISGDSIVAQKFIDEGLNERQAYHQSELSEDPIVKKKFVL